MNDMIVSQLRPRGSRVTPEESSEMLAAVVAQRRSPLRRHRGYFITAACVAPIVGTAIFVGSQFVDGDDQGQRDQPQSAAPGRCASLVQVDGAIYEAWGVVGKIPADRVASGRLSACDDTGENPRGAHFPPNAEEVQIWTLRDEDPAQVVGVPKLDGFTVFVAVSLEDSEGEQIFDRLEDAAQLE